MNMVNYSEIIDKRSGLINYLEYVPYKNMGLNLYRYMASIKQNFCNKEFLGSGFSYDKELAMNKAIGEAIERYCAVIINDNILEYEVANFLDYKCILPLEFNRYTADQYKRIKQFEKFRENKKRNWVLSIDFITKDNIFLPFETVYLLIPRNHKPFRDVISTGLACGISFMHAFENALNECIERDAFMLFWLLGNIQYEININSIKNTKIATYLDCATALNYDIKLYNISQPKLKTYTILSIFKTKGKKGFYMATSTNRNLFKAIQGSIEEGISGYTSFKEKIAFYGLVPPSTLDDIHSLEDHASYYVAGKYDEILPTIIKSDLQTKYIQDVFHEYTFDEMIESVSSVTNIYYTELTTVDISSLNLHCLRVVTPKLLFLPYGNEPMLESERLYKLAKNKKINTIPHPFP